MNSRPSSCLDAPVQVASPAGAGPARVVAPGAGPPPSPPRPAEGGEERLAQVRRRVPARMADDVRHARDPGGARIPHGDGDGHQARFDQLVVQGAVLRSRPRGPSGEVLVAPPVLRGRRHGREVAVLRVPRPAGAPGPPLLVRPLRREQLARRGAFGGEQVADAETEGHRAAAGRLVDEADAVAVGDRQGHGLVQFVGEAVRVGGQQRGQAQRGQVGVAELHDVGGQDRVPAVETDVSHAGEGRGDAVDRGAGEAGGPLQGAQAHRAARLGQLPQHGDPADQRRDRLRRRLPCLRGRDRSRDRSGCGRLRGHGCSVLRYGGGTD